MAKKKRGTGFGSFEGDHSLGNVGSSKKRAIDRSSSFPKEHAQSVRPTLVIAEGILFPLSNVQIMIEEQRIKEAARKHRVSAELGKGTCMAYSNDLNIRVAEPKHVANLAWRTRRLDDPSKHYLLQVPCPKSKSDQCGKCILGNSEILEVGGPNDALQGQVYEVAHGIKLDPDVSGLLGHVPTSYHRDNGDPIAEIDKRMEVNLARVEDNDLAGQQKNTASPMFGEVSVATTRMFSGDTMF